mmetsp:Transcript_12430/g.15558  ORF Transcript_12430/g.15558 Transcript_12430/m.15558 type:complete len:906 (-) Transcript_12430:163-2880(-)|eukprot:CAMPEP_0172502526 /NCGR_PEP_ID=MMETSP1066-20121228/160961_1 /TAXON_ID=671091 /ORGANISM="Coscinodiscus wailesii, Strain CCMP2513" /LENGTH=905 /DNA_ID=CAMNT_0013277821 /DNA_START=265 /DNA_END=2982 /DNA_ORIENTATION=-
MGVSNNNPQAGQGRPLPKRESDLFKSVVKHYECKQYKKGTKAADNILRKFPNHGETLAMKGLTLNCMGKREEAHELVRKGLMNDMRSHVCWHVFGLLHRSDRNYNEAIKAYKQALRIDPENLQILRDLSLLQIQMRDLPGFVVTRHTILTLKPNNKIHWLAFALAKHLTGDAAGAVSVIDIYLGTLSPNSPELRRGFESSELALYRNVLLGEGDDHRATLADLEKCRHLVVDETAWHRAKARCELRLGEYEDARRTFLRMLENGGAEDYRNHAGYQCAVLGRKEWCDLAMTAKGTETLATLVVLSDEEKGELLGVYKELGKRLPRSHAVKRIPLTLLQGEELKSAIDKYCRYDLSKGVPCLAEDLASLFVVVKDGSVIRVTDPADVKTHPLLKMVVGLVDEFISSLETTSRFPGCDAEESPSTLLWAWYLRAQLHECCGEYTSALSFVEKCLEHTPTAVDAYELKARILLQSGDVGAAAECVDAGRELDKQDRYINNMTTRYMLLANREGVARDRIALFTRHEGNPEQNLYDMQCTWYELELAACLARQGDYGKSLKKYMAVEKHFEDFNEDQFDFHSYCIRKVTLRAYVDVLRFENELWSQKYYGRAAEGIIKNYIHLFDNPNDATKKPAGADEPDYSNMTSAEKKKAKALARRKKKQAEKKAAAAQEEKKKKENGGKENGTTKKGGKQSGGVQRPEVVDEDPDGKELLKRDPLEEAKKYVATLVKNAPRRFSTWILAYDVAIRRGKETMALQALFKAKTLNPQSPQLFTRIVDFALKQQKNTSPNPNQTVQNVLQTTTATLLDNLSIETYVTSTATTIKSNPLSSLPARVAAAKALINTTTQQSVTVATALITQGGMDGREVSVDNCQKALEALKSFGEEAEGAVKEWIEMVKARYPLATNIQ